MENSVNNNVNNSANNNATLNYNVPNLGTTGVVTPANANANSTNTVQTATVVMPTTGASNTTVSNPTAVAQAPVASSATVINPNVATTTQTVNTSKKNNSNTYLIVGFFVGFVLLAAVFLLVLLLTGVIGNRNRLTCTKTVTENGYTHVTQKVYKFDGDVYIQVNNLDTYTYTALTDDVYNEKFDKIINNETNGITEYGFGTQIFREGNVVKITSYNPNFFGEKYNDVKSADESNGFTCE